MEFRTKDIWIATALFTLGFECKAEVIGTLKNGRKQYEFVFDESQELKDKLYDYGNKNLSLDIKTFQGNFSTLKNLMFD